MLMTMAMVADDDYDDYGNARYDYVDYDVDDDGVMKMMLAFDNIGDGADVNDDYHAEDDC
jgi:hypothetical protein